jgi:D-amino-acid dehydrogenase
MTGPHVVIVGAGVVGVASTAALALQGHRVTVVEASTGPAEVCSLANAGILAVGHASAWAGPSAIGSMLRAIAHREPGVRVTKYADPALWSWGARFLCHCTASAHARNTDKLQRLSRMSREVTQDLAIRLGLDDLVRHEGGLYLFQNEDQFREHAASVRGGSADPHGGMVVLDRAALIEREPALALVADKLTGGIYSPVDSVGDCHQFTCQVAEVLARDHAVTFRFDTRVTGFTRHGGTITGVETDQGEVKADAVVLATGVETSNLTRALGFAPHIYPVKGYSGTWTILDPSRIPRLPFVDETELLAVASYGGRLRVTAIAEFAGSHDLSLPEARLDVLRDYVARLFGNAIDPDNAQFWTGQRPSTPAGPPYLGRVRSFDNLWINAGHGQLGWTMAAGCGALIAQALTNGATELHDVSSTASWLDPI